MLKNPIFITIAILTWLTSAGLIAYDNYRRDPGEIAAAKTAIAKAEAAVAKVEARARITIEENRHRADLNRTRLQQSHEITMANQRLQESILTRDDNGMGWRLCFLAFCIAAVSIILYLNIQNIQKEIREVRRQARREPQTQLLIRYADLQQAGFLPEKTGGKYLHILSVRTSERGE